MQQSIALALATIAAIIIGPVVALWLQRISERRRDQRNRKLVIFKELMATRATRVSPRHVDALNAIEVEFSDGSVDDKRVLEAWRLYLDHLGDDNAGDNHRWTAKGNDLLTDLLYEMSRALRYDFSKITLKKNVYSPRAHGDLELDQYLLRKYVVEMLAGERPIWTGIFTGEKALDVRMAGETDDTLHAPVPPNRVPD